MRFVRFVFFFVYFYLYYNTTALIYIYIYFIVFVEIVLVEVCRRGGGNPGAKQNLRTVGTGVGRAGVGEFANLQLGW